MIFPSSQEALRWAHTTKWPLKNNRRWVSSLAHIYETRMVMKATRINSFPNNRLGLHEICCTLLWKRLRLAGSTRPGGVGWEWSWWWADLWSGGGDCGANGFKGGGRVGVRALHCTSVRLMTPQRDYSGRSTQLHKAPLRFWMLNMDVVLLWSPAGDRV